MAPLYPSAKGEKAWPPLAMFKALLLATWHDLSDVALAEALSDRASFRRFCGFARDEERPSAPPSCASAACSLHMGLTGASLRRSRAISTPRAPLCVKARSSMPP